MEIPENLSKFWLLTENYFPFRCEITPRLKYIVRRFDIQQQDWYGYIYHYNDSWCQNPMFTTKVTGTYEVLPGTATPNSKASFPTKFIFDKIYFRIVDAAHLETVVNFILLRCPSAFPTIFKTQEDETINSDEFINVDVMLDNSVLQKKHCRYFFGLHPATFRKIRMVKTRKESSSIKYDELYFGNIPSFALKSQKTFVALEFQYALLRHSRPNCEACRSIHAHANQIPRLPNVQFQKELEGNWITETCVAQDDQNFVSKYYHFSGIYSNKNYGEVTIYQSYFTDADCRKRKLDLKTGGIYSKLVANSDITDVMDVTFTLTWLALTGYDDSILRRMKIGESCGESEKWQFGVEQNVTSTNGCDELNMNIPTTKVLKTRIYSTKYGKEFYINDDNEEEFFTNNLISCNSIPVNLTRFTTSPPTLGNNVEEVDNTVNKNIEEVLLKEKYKNKSNAGSTLKVEFLMSTVLTFLSMYIYL